jgi:hypothetical protein
MPRTLIKRGLLLISIIAAGCASASITPQQTAEPAKPLRPQMIYVRNFAVVAEDVKESHGTISQTERKFSSTTDRQREMDIGHSAAKELSDQLTKDLQALGFTVQEQTGELAPGGDVLLVEGQFISVDEGAAGRRVMIGFGVGQSTLDTQVQVYRVSNGSRQKLLEFTTHADSGKLPGTGLLMGASAVATGGVTAAGAAVSGGIAGGKVYLGRVDYLSDKTADQVNAYLSHYFAEQGWISPDKAQAQTVNIAPEPAAAATPNSSNTL